jgi:hypothetical protein
VRAQYDSACPGAKGAPVPRYESRFITWASGTPRGVAQEPTAEPASEPTALLLVGTGLFGAAAGRWPAPAVSRRPAVRASVNSAIFHASQDSSAEPVSLNASHVVTEE